MLLWCCINLRFNNEIRTDRNVTYYIGGWKEDKKLWSYCYDFKDININILLLVLRDIMPPEIIDMICEQLYLVTYHYDF